MAAKSASEILSAPRMQMRRSGGMGGQIGTQYGGGLQTGQPTGFAPRPPAPVMGPARGGMATGPMAPRPGALPDVYAASSAPTMGLTGTSQMPQVVAPSPDSMTTAAPLTTAPSSYSGNTSQLFPPSFPPPPNSGGNIGEVDPWGRPTGPPYGPKIGRKGAKKFGGSKYARRAWKKLPPWMQDPTMFNTAIGSINDILGSNGYLSPEILQRQQADIEAGRGQGQQALAARLAAAGVDPSSPMALSMGGTMDQAANRLQHTARSDEDIRAAMQRRQDIQQVIPWLQAILGFTTKKGGGGVQAAPVGGVGGQSPDYAGLVASTLGQVGAGWASTNFGRGY